MEVAVGGGEGDYTPIDIHCHHRNDFCIKVGSDESHFNVHNCEGQSHKTVSTDRNPFEEKGEPKQIRTEVLTPYHQAKPAHKSGLAAAAVFISRGQGVGGSLRS